MDKLAVPSHQSPHVPGSSPTMSVAATVGPTALSMPHTHSSHSPRLSHGLLLRSSSSSGSLTPGSSGQHAHGSSSTFLPPVPPAPRLSIIPPSTAAAASGSGGNLFFSQQAPIVLIPQSLQPSDVLRLPLCTDGDCLAIGRLVESKRSTMIVTDTVANLALASSASASSPPPPIPPLPSHPSSTALQLNPALSSSTNNNTLGTPQPTRKPKVVADYNKAIIMLRSKVISRHHCRIFRQNKRYWIQDTKSSSGTFVNGRRLSAINVESAPFEVFDGDLLQLGEDYDHQGVIHECLRYKVVINPVDTTPSASDHNLDNDPDGAAATASSPEMRPNPSDAAASASESEFATIWAALAPSCPSTVLQPLVSGMDPKVVIESSLAVAPNTPVEPTATSGSNAELTQSIAAITWPSDSIRDQLLALAQSSDPRLDLLHSSLASWSMDSFRVAALKLAQKE